MSKKSMRLESREIEKIPKTPRLSPELVDALTRLCFLEDEPEPADLIFVFGSNINHLEIAAMISGLLQKNISRKVIITGGKAEYENSHFDEIAESEQILSHIPCSDYPDAIFIRESLSKNSLENVVEAARIYDFSKEPSILFISHSYASRRSRLTMQRICGDAKLISYPFDIPAPGSAKERVSRKRWWKTAAGKSMVWGEYLRFLTYGERGDFPIDEIRNQLETISRLLEQDQ